MVDRVQLLDGVVARGSVGQGDADDIDGDAALNLADGQNRPVAIQRVCEACRRAGPDKNRAALAVRTVAVRQRPRCRDRSIGRGVKVTDTAEIAAKSIFVERNRGVRRNGRRVVVDRQVEHAVNEGAVAVRDTVRKLERKVVLIHAGRMIDRIELRDRVVARNRIGQRDLQDVDADAVLNLADGQNRPVAAQRVSETGRRARAEKQDGARSVEAERESKRARQRDRAIGGRIKIADAAEVASRQRVLIESDGGVGASGRRVIDECLIQLVVDNEIRQFLLAQQIEGIWSRQWIDASLREVRARRLCVAVAGTRCRKNRLVFRNRKQRCEFGTGQIAAGRNFDGNAIQRFAGRVEERLERDARLVVEKNDELLADMDECNLLVCNRRKIDLDRSIKAQRNGNRLLGERFGNLDGTCGRFSC